MNKIWNVRSALDTLNINSKILNHLRDLSDIHEF